MPAKKNKIQNLSTRWLGPLRWVLYAVYSGLFLTILIYFFLSKEAWLAVMQGGVYVYVFYAIIRMASKLQQVSFDDEFLYVKLKLQEMIIPLENIESVEIQTLGGVYKVNLYEAEQLGKEFFFKPSLLYPLNYKKKDALVNQLRRNIDRAKNRRQSLPTNALHS